MNFKAISPETTHDLLKAIKQNRGTDFRFGAGYTDLILELKKQPVEDVTVINLANLNDDDFTSIQKVKEGIRIGALVNVADLISDKELQSQFPVLIEAADSLASMQIRTVATVGGNLCTASPAGDISCALTALKTKCEILDSDGKIRTVPILEFFTDVNKTVLRKDEILRSVCIPQNSSALKSFSGFIKIGTRNSMEISIVSLAYHILSDKDGNIISSGIAIGSVAPTIKFTHSACDFLIGKNFFQLTESEQVEFADRVLEYASPISDIRASAWYRKEVLYNISKSIFEN